MKNKLQSLIRRAINEVLNEDENALVATKSGTKVIPFKNTTELSSLVADSNVSSITTTSGKKLKEMARPVIMYKLADGYEDKLSELEYFGSEKRMKWVNGIIEYIDQEGPSDITTIATEKFA